MQNTLNYEKSIPKVIHNWKFYPIWSNEQFLQTKPFNHNFESNHWKNYCWKWKQNIITFFHPQTQTTSVISNPNRNCTETTESIFHTGATEKQPATSLILKPDINTPLNVLTKTIRTSPDLQNDPFIFELSPCRLHIRKIPPMQIIINSKFTILQHYQFRNLILLTEEYIYIIHSLIS